MLGVLKGSLPRATNCLRSIARAPADQRHYHCKEYNRLSQYYSGTKRENKRNAVLTRPDRQAQYRQNHGNLEQREPAKRTSRLKVARHESPPDDPLQAPQRSHRDGRAQSSSRPRRPNRENPATQASTNNQT